MDKKISLKEKILILMRSFFIQGAWNYLRFQNIGYLFTILHYLKKIHSSEEDLKKAALRHFDIFNTQPYMANIVIGNILRMEEETASNKDEIIKIRHSLACAYASIGDRLFWSRLRIITLEFTAFILIIFINTSNLSNVLKITAMAVFFPSILYAAFSIYIRWKGFDWGYQCGGKESCGLNFLDWNNMIGLASIAGFGLAAFLIVFMILMTLYSLIGQNFWNYILNTLPIIFAFFAQRYFKTRKKSIEYSIIAVIAFSFLTNLLRL